MNNSDIRISESEYEVMKYIWDNGNVKAIDIVASLSRSKDWNDKTIKTLINRLLKKGAINYTKDKNSYIYYATIERAAYQEYENKSFLHRFYDGSIKAMISSFVKDGNLTEKDIEELRDILRDKDKHE